MRWRHGRRASEELSAASGSGTQGQNASPSEAPPPYTPPFPSDAATSGESASQDVKKPLPDTADNNAAEANQPQPLHQQPPEDTLPSYSSIQGSPSSPTRSHRPAPAGRVSEADSQLLLTTILHTHPWRRTYGPPPRSLADGLVTAALHGNRPLALALLAAGAPVPAPPGYPYTNAVHAALRGPDPALGLAILERACRASPEPGRRLHELLSARNAEGCFPLHIAAAAGETSIVGELVRLGAAVDSVDGWGRTALHMAARYGRKETVKCLLDLGAKVVEKRLWEVVGNMATEELGSYTLIMDVVKEASGVKEGKAEDTKGGEEQGPGDGHNEGNHHSKLLQQGPRSLENSAEIEGTADLVSAGKEGSVYEASKEGLETDAPPSEGLSETIHASPSQASAPNTAIPQANYPPTTTTTTTSPLDLHQYNPYPLLNTSAPSTTAEILSNMLMSEQQRSLPRIRQQHQTMVFTPEYLTWREGMETLRSEHRAQKERDQKEGTSGSALS